MLSKEIKSHTVNESHSQIFVCFVLVVFESNGEKALYQNQGLMRAPSDSCSVVRAASIAVYSFTFCGQSLLKI